MSAAGFHFCESGAQHNTKHNQMTSVSRSRDPLEDEEEVRRLRLKAQVEERQQQEENLRQQVESVQRQIDGIREDIETEITEQSRLRELLARKQQSERAHSSEYRLLMNELALLKKERAAVLQDRATAAREYEREQYIFKQVYEKRIEAMAASVRLCERIREVNEERSRYRAEYRRNEVRCQSLTEELAHVQNAVQDLEETLADILEQHKNPVY